MLGLDSGWELDHKPGPLVWFGFETYVTRVPLDQLPGDGKTQSSTLAQRLRREEGLEDFRLRLFIDSAARVLDSQDDQVALLFREQSDLRPVRTSVRRVENQIEEHLGDIVRVS